MRLEFAFVALLLLSGCATTAPGLVYSNVYEAVAVTESQAGNRVGVACSTSILGLVATGDSSIERARRNGGITKITSVDRKRRNVLFLYYKNCTIARGR